jgi:hypothetical protein
MAARNPANAVDQAYRIGYRVAFAYRSSKTSGDR